MTKLHRIFASRFCSRDWLLITCSVGMVLILIAGTAKAKDNNLHFDGSLVAEPCTLDPETTDITLDFGTVIDKYLYLNKRTHSQPFTLNLLDCDISLGSSAVFTFRGTESKELPGLLALSSGTASGIAIGIELEGGKALPINKPTPEIHFTAGATPVTLWSYVEGEPSAIQNQSIGKGDFTAIATFEIDYP